MKFLQIPGIVPTDSIADVPTPREELSALKNLPVDEMISKVASELVSFAIHLAVAILVFYIGRFIIKRLYKVVKSIMLHRQVDRSLTSFVLSLVNIVLYFILIVTVIGILGLETSSFLAIFASAGVAIGMALSGTLQNFAGGVLILLLKPYRVGDYIEAQGFAGYVKEIQIFHTVIVTFDNKSITIPNGGLSTGSINNWSREEYRRVDWNVSISYGDSVEAARRVILEILASDSRVVSEYIEDHREEYEAQQAAEAQLEASASGETAPVDGPKRSWLYRLFHRPKKALDAKLERIDEEREAKMADFIPKINRAPVVFLKEMADSSINLTVRAWTRTDDYWGVYFDMNERFYTELPSKGLSFPFPQLDVHLPEGLSAK